MSVEGISDSSQQAKPQGPAKLRPAAVAFVAVVVGIGLPIVAYALWRWESQDLLRFSCYLGIALFASLLKVSLPGIAATMSVNFLFILIGILEMGFSETLLMGCAAGLFQSIWRSRPRPRLVQLFFNLGSLAIATAASYQVFHSGLGPMLGLKVPLLLALATTIYFVLNTLPVSAVISMTDGGSIQSVWKQCYFWSFPYYLLGAALAGGVSALNKHIGWQASLLVIPVIYWIYRSYRMYLARLQAEKRHVEEVASLHLRTIEALALAIEAKDHTTHDHLRRVQIYATEIGKDLGLSESEMAALRAAALLHDIGKLAVPEQILSKPGKLAPEEFEKMKIHPVVGAEILDRVKFPYPVGPVVRSHHEKWSGHGYPDGLQGEEIPVGARVLSAVDCFDALASERPYRRAMSLEEAMAYVREQAGESFDPRVVDVLERRYLDLEKLVQVQGMERKKLVTDVRIERSVIPSTGFAATKPEIPADGNAMPINFLASIAAARQEAQMLFELSQLLGNSLNLKETLSVVSVRLKNMVPHDSIVVYVRKDDILLPEHAHGVDFHLFTSLRIPMGGGLSGWVAENQKPIVNGNPSVESSYLKDATKKSSLQSALAVPLIGRSGVTGVLTLYSREKDAFSTDHLRILLATGSKLGLSIENALEFERAESSASTDFLTGLLNARSLYLRLDSELARCCRTNATLAVLICDLNGFKAINDRHGHLVGNKVLQEVAAALKAFCREYDTVGRLGGDEFLVVIPGSQQETVRSQIERLCEMAVQAGRQACGTDGLSMSIGEAFYPEDGASAEQLLAEADRRMYACKEAYYARIGEGPASVSSR